MSLPESTGPRCPAAERAPDVVFRDIRSRLTDGVLIMFSLVGVVGVPISMLRAFETGWQPLMAIQLGWYALFVAAAVFRRRLSFPVRAAIVIGVTFALGVFGTATYGLAGCGPLLLFSFIGLSATLLGRWAGLTAAGLSLATLGVVGAALHAGLLTLRVDMTEYAVAPTSWLATALAMLILTAVVVFSLGRLHSELVQAIKELAARNAAVEEANARLNNEMGQRQAAEEALHLRLEFEQLVTAISTRFINLPSKQLYDEMTHGLAEVAEFLGVDRGYILELAEDRASFSCIAEWVRADRPAHRASIQGVPTEHMQPWLERMERGEIDRIVSPEIVPANDARARELMVQFGAVSVIQVPLRRGDTLLGVLGFATDATPLDWPRDHEALLRVAAQAFANALDRAAMEQALRDSEDSLHVFINALPEPAFLLDAEGTVLVMNEEATRRMRNTQEGVLGRNAFELLPPDAVKERYDKFRQVLETGQPVRFEDHRADRWYINYLYPVLDAAGSVSRVAIFAIDITERLQVESERARLAMAIEQGREHVAITDARGGIVYVNPAFEQAIGYAREELNDRALDSLGSPQDDPLWRDVIWPTVRGGSIWSGRLTKRHKEGALIHVESAVSPIISEENGAIAGFVATHHDVTHETELEAQLRQSQKLEALGTLAGGIAHDFNNILSPILGYAALIAEDLEPGTETHECVAEIIAASNRARDLVQQILTFSRRTEQQRQPCRIASVVKEAVKLLRGSLPATIHIEETIDPDCPLVLADPTQIHQVLMNLCTNAYHAMERSGGVLTVRLTRAQVTEKHASEHWDLEPGTYCCLTVADTGSGMDAATRRRIFEPYFTTKAEGKGTGLGLATVHGIVKAHEGIVTVYSEAGRGAEFRVYLPAIAEGADAPRIAPAAPPRGRGECVLVVDDESTVLTFEERALRRAGYTVRAYADPQAALDAFALTPGRYAAAVVDGAMPGMTGGELAEGLRAIAPGLPIVMVSGFSSPALKAEAKAAGVARVLAKPLEPQELCAALHDLLHNGAPARS